ncbi:murein biosynthesis integral membrane protein MurJ [Oligoflexaceae bacterium]|nr:murein biosynthesis integral membrane protein MurJ [Oligoflexaceae bacterium]
MSVFKSSLFFSMGTMLSRLTGLLRESTLAGVFGASVFLDAFLVAYRIPNLLRDMLAEGALSGAFTKVYTATYEKDPGAAGRLFKASLMFFGAIALVVIALGMVFAPELVDLMTLVGDYDANAEFKTNAVLLTRILFPFILFPILGSIAMGVLHRHKGFFITGISPVLLNLGFIGGAIGLSNYQEWASLFGYSSTVVNNAVIGLAVGVLVGGFLQFAWQFIFAWQRSDLSKPEGEISEFLKKVLVLMAPAAIAASAGPITAFVNTNFATSLGEGAVSWLYFSFRLLQLPVGVFGVAIGVAALPSLTRLITKAGGVVDAEASKQLQSCLQIMVWLMVPASLFLYTAADNLIGLFFQHAKFSALDALATTEALRAYCFGVLGYGLIKVLSSYYFAVDRTSYAMKVSLLGIGVTVLVNFLLIDHFGHVGLAYGAATTLTLNAILLLIGTRKDAVQWEMARFWKLALAVGLALAASIFLHIVYNLSLNDEFSMVRDFAPQLPLSKWQHFIGILIHAALIGLPFAVALYASEKKSPVKLLKS